MHLKNSKIWLAISLSILMFACAPVAKQTYINQGLGYQYDIPVPSNLTPLQEKTSEYQLQPGDVVHIRVTSLTPTEFDFLDDKNDVDLRVDPLLTGYRVDNDGNVTLPFVGKLVVRGQTLNEAQASITKVLAEYLDSPTVNLRLVSFDFTVLGEVNRQGKYSILESQINILEAIGSASGLTEFANFEKVKVLRTESGVSTVGTVNLLQENLPTSPYYYLKPNDVVIVDQLTSKNFRRNSSSNIALILSAVGTTVTLILAVDNLSTK